MEEEKKFPQKCPKCGGKILYFSGVNREGKEYHFWGCVHRKTCGWIYKEPSKAEQRHEKEMRALKLIYAKLLDIEKEIKEIALKSKEFQKVNTDNNLSNKK